MNSGRSRQIARPRGRPSAVGRDTISYPDRGQDDVANAVAGAVALSKFGGYDTSMRWVSGDDDDSAWQRVRLQAFINSGGASDYDGVARPLKPRAPGILRRPHRYLKRCEDSTSIKARQIVDF